MSKRVVVVGMVVGIALLTFSGCACSNYETLERNWGRSYESMVFLQTANPDAGKDLSAVEGMEGLSSIIITDEYRETFKRPETKIQTFNIYTK